MAFEVHYSLLLFLVRELKYIVGIEQGDCIAQEQHCKRAD